MQKSAPLSVCQLDLLPVSLNLSAMLPVLFQNHTQGASQASQLVAALCPFSHFQVVNVGSFAVLLSFVFEKLDTFLGKKMVLHCTLHYIGHSTAKLLRQNGQMPKPISDLPLHFQPVC